MRVTSKLVAVVQNLMMPALFLLLLVRVCAGARTEPGVLADAAAGLVPLPVKTEVSCFLSLVASVNMSLLDRR